MTTATSTPSAIRKFAVPRADWPHRPADPQIAARNRQIADAARTHVRPDGTIPTTATDAIAKRFGVTRGTILATVHLARSRGWLPPVDAQAVRQAHKLEVVRRRLDGQADAAGQYPRALLESVKAEAGITDHTLQTYISELRRRGLIPGFDKQARRHARMQAQADAIRPHLDACGRIGLDAARAALAAAGHSYGQHGTRVTLADLRRHGYLPRRQKSPPKPRAPRVRTARPRPVKLRAMSGEDDESRLNRGPLVIPPELQPDALRPKVIDGPWRQTSQGLAYRDDQRLSGVALWLEEWRRGWDAALAGYLRDHLTESGADAEDDAA